MDRMKTKWLCGFGWVVALLIFPMEMVRADDGYSPTYSASPSASTPAAVEKTPQVSCSVKVVLGDNTLAPAEVKFDADGYVGQESIGQFAFDFGDGTVKTGSDKITHRYGQAGTYTVTVSPLADNLKHDAMCTTTATLIAAPLTSRKVECTSLTINSDSLTATDAARLQVRGYDSRGEIDRYKFQANNNEWESDDGNFEIVFNTPGDYTLRGFVKAADGDWVGGEGLCRKEVRIKAAGVTKQPETGPTMMYWLGLGSLTLVWLGGELWQKLSLKRLG